MKHGVKDQDLSVLAAGISEVTMQKFVYTFVVDKFKISWVVQHMLNTRDIVYNIRSGSKHNICANVVSNGPNEVIVFLDNVDDGEEITIIIMA